MYSKKIQEELKEQLMRDIPEKASDVDFYFDRYTCDITYSIGSRIIIKADVPLDFISLNKTPWERVFIKAVYNSQNKQFIDAFNKMLADKLWEDK